MPYPDGLEGKRSSIGFEEAQLEGEAWVWSHLQSRSGVAGLARGPKSLEGDPVRLMASFSEACSLLRAVVLCTTQGLRLEPLVKVGPVFCLLGFQVMAAPASGELGVL